MLDPVEFQGFRIPSSSHCYTTGILPGADIRPADRPLRCGPSQPSHTMQEFPTELCPDSQNSGMKTTGTGDRSLPGRLVAAPLIGESLLQDKNSHLQCRQALLKPQPRATQEDESIKLGSSPQPISVQSRILPKESIRTFNDCKSTVSGNVHNMKVRF